MVVCYVKGDDYSAVSDCVIKVCPLEFWKSQKKWLHWLSGGNLHPGHVQNECFEKTMSGLGILMRSPDLCQTNTHGFNLQLQVATLMAPVTHSEIVELRQ